MMGLCVNLFTVDANFEMGPRWIFLRWSIFYWWLLISCELVFIFHKFSYAWFAMAERRRERKCVREKREERERKLPQWRKLLQGKFEGFFLRFHHFFPIKCFPDQNNLSPTKKSPCRKFYPTNTISEDTLIYVRKSFKNDIRIEVRIKIHFNYCFTVLVLIEVGNGKIAKC